MEIFKKYTPIQLKLLITYLALVIGAILLLGVVTNYIFSNSLEKEAVNNALRINEQMLNNLDYYISDLEKVGFIVQNNSQAAELLRKDNNYLSEAVRVRDEYILYRSFKDFIGYKNDVRCIILIAVNGSLFKFSEEALSVTEDAKNDDWYIEAVKSPKSKLIQGPNYTSYYKENKDKKVFSLLMKLEGPPGTTWEKEKLGIIRIDSSIQFLKDLYSMEYYAYSSKYRTTIIDEGLNIIFDTNQINIGHKVNRNIAEILKHTSSGKFYEYYEGEKMLYVVSTSRNTGCKVLHSIPVNDLLKDVIYIRLITVAIGAICIILAFAVSILLSYKITIPIKLLMRRMRKVEEGNLERWELINAKDEIGDLTNNFSQMTNRLHDMIKKEYALKIKEQEAELNALQSQITPHFLYNTLETVRCIAIAKDVGEIGIIAQSLAGMFRYSIKGEKVSTIEKEIEHVNAYLSIQKIRNPGKFNTLIKIEDGLESFRIIKLLLQPLVENAVEHGLGKSETGGLIAILIKKNGGLLEIKIIDNGQGFDKAELEELNGLLSEERKNCLEYNNKKFSIGILNVHSRIKLYYGNEFGLKYESRKGAGTTVYISIPAVTERSNEDGTENIDC